MWRLHARCEALAFFVEHTQAARRQRLFAASKHPLHPNTDAQEGNTSTEGLYNGLLQTCAFQRFSRSKMTDPGKHHLRRCSDLRRIRSNGALLPQPVERLFHRNQVPGAVIDNRNHHSTPLVLGKSRAMRRSRQQAARNARANALKSASILWWLDRPYSVRTCTLARAPRAKPSKKSCTSSACRSPTMRTRTLVSTTADVRPQKSTAAMPSVSSIGIRKYP